MLVKTGENACSQHSAYFHNVLTLHHTIPTFNNPIYDAIENIVRKGENDGNQHFLLFPQCFLAFPQKNSISVTFIFLSADPLKLE